MTGPATGEAATRQVPGAQDGAAPADPIPADLPGILDTIDIPLVVVGLDCKVVRFNRAAAEVLGLAPSDILRHTCDIRALADVKDLDHACARVMADGEPCRRDVPKGDRSFLLSIAPYTGTDRRVRGAVLTFTNVTGFRASIAQAIYEREYTKTILNTVIEPLVVLDHALLVQTANRAFYEWFGVSREQAQGVPLRDLGDDAWKSSALWPSLRAALDDNREFRTVELERAFPAGGRRTVLLDARRLARDGTGLLLLAFRDITARKELEREREAMLAHEERLRMDAEEATRAKDRFLAVLSHELRTPLSPVLMAVAAMGDDPDLPPALREDVAMIRRNIELETRLIDDLLDLSRVTSGKMRLQVQPTLVHEALRHALQNCAADTSSKKLNVRLDLRAADEPVSADPARLQQVFWNLLRNAAKFTPDGGDVNVRTETAGGKVLIEVRDSGVGIAPEFLERVFDAFDQGDINARGQSGGLGLGLAVCRAVVDLHGGTIRAHSDGPGRGATFTVELPATAAPGPKSPGAAHPSGHDAANGHLRVLLVEDHPDTRNVLARLLGASRHAVTTTGTVEGALRLAAAERFDIVVSDLGLPDGTGYDLMKQVSQRYGIKGIALSGYGMEEDQRRSREAGFLEHIVKPVDLGKLEAAIKRVAGSPTSE